MIWPEHWVSAPGSKKLVGSPSPWSGTQTLATGPISVCDDEDCVRAVEQPIRRRHTIAIRDNRADGREHAAYIS